MFITALNRFFSPRSVSGRLRLASCVLLPVMLGVTALILEQAFSRSLEASTRERLKLQTYVLLAAAEAGGGELWMPATLQEPRFSQPGSGLYGFVSDQQGQLLWRSASTLGQPLPPLPRTDAQDRASFGRDDQGLFYFHYPVVWETEDGRETPFLFTSLEAPRAYTAELSGFRAHLWSGLSLLALLLLLAQGLILRWGLRPLMRIADDLKAIEQGQHEQLKGNYPKEVEPVTTNLNRLILAERRQRERYRHTLADLAHSLKTPLAVVRNAAQSSTEQSSTEQSSAEQSSAALPSTEQSSAEQRWHAPMDIVEQIDRMDQIISHQLGRASAQADHSLLQPVSVLALIERITKALQKVYRNSASQYEIIGDDRCFRGDERDLMEMLGNLIDNAFKYGQGRVRVTLSQTDSELQICVEDNGPGIPQSQHQAIIQRGVRADRRQTGQGIGLAVVSDMVAEYNGRLLLDRSELGGARFQLRLPQG